MTTNSQIVKKNPSPYNKITGDVATHINKIMIGNYQQAALGTIDKNDQPMVTKIIPMWYSGCIYLLLSDLSEHTRNLSNNPNTSIYFAEEEKHKIKSNNPRLTLQGTLQKMTLGKDSSEFQMLLKHYNKIEPGSKMWAMFADFNFYIFCAKRKLFVEGFGKAYEEKIKEKPKK